VIGFNYPSFGEPVETVPNLQEEARATAPPLLEIELLEHPTGGCVARMSGNLVGGTAAALWSIEPMMANEVQVVLDLSGIVTIDSAGLEATVRLMDAIRGFGGRLIVGSDEAQILLPGHLDDRPSQGRESSGFGPARTRLPGAGLGVAWERAIAVTDRTPGGSHFAGAG
jgi:ABC-type transporter Mla MlaB component